MVADLVESVVIAAAWRAACTDDRAHAARLFLVRIGQLPRSAL